MAIKPLHVVLMNWARPRDLLDLAWTYAGLGVVASVNLWNPAADLAGRLVRDAADLRCRKIRLIQSSADYGLYARFAVGALVPADPVLLTDDDIELTPAALAALSAAWEAEPDIVHGILGRRPAADGTYSTLSYADRGPCEVVLTRAAVASRWLCGAALANGARVLDEHPGQPRGNGEDIVLSYTALQASGRLNRVYPDLPYRNLAGAFAPESISVRYPGHAAHRTAVVRWCVAHLLPRAGSC